MFRIGEFAHIAQVSTRLLRYYDQLGLLEPVRIEPETGYRYYSAKQLPRLNRILALKELGLTLDQIGEMLERDLPADELRGMLALRRAEVQQTLQSEQSKLRQIESRIQQLDDLGALREDDVVLKSVDARPFLAHRRLLNGMEEAIQLLQSVVRHRARAKAAKPERLTVVAHSTFDDDRLDLEIGFVTASEPRRAVTLADELVLQPSELPAVERMAAVVRAGPNYQAHLALGKLGSWIENSGYVIAGPCREVFLDIPVFDPAGGEAVIEIQYPVEDAA